MFAEKERPSLQDVKNRAIACDDATNSGVVRFAVFDFDGTSIDCHSPVELVKYLVKRRMLRPSIIFRILLWAGAYHFHLPQNEAWVRGLVFSAFEGKAKAHVDAFLADFYDKVIDPHFRARAQELIDEHKRAGEKVLVVSATFEPIALRAQEKHGFDAVLAVQMRVDNEGNYTRELVGEPTEGAQKVVAIQQYADALYGRGNWEISFVYADHYSDIPLLEQAKHPCAVCPGPSLKREALKRNWPIEEWE